MIEYYCKVNEKPSSERHPWHWQGDGEDHLESLACPILIEASDLRGLLKSERQKIVERIRHELLNNIMHYFCINQYEHIVPLDNWEELWREAE